MTTERPTGTRAEKLTYKVFGVRHSVEVRQMDPFNES